VQWIEAAKIEQVPGAANRHIGVSIATVTNLVVDGCQDHNPANLPIGTTVDDLATALAKLAPFPVTSSPRDVTIYGDHENHRTDRARPAVRRPQRRHPSSPAASASN
jgi:hypothetical protein